MKAARNGYVSKVRTQRWPATFPSEEAYVKTVQNTLRVHPKNNTKFNHKSNRLCCRGRSSWPVLYLWWLIVSFKESRPSWGPPGLWIGLQGVCCVISGGKTHSLFGVPFPGWDSALCEKSQAASHIYFSSNCWLWCDMAIYFKFLLPYFLTMKDSTLNCELK